MAPVLLRSLEFAGYASAFVVTVDGEHPDFFGPVADVGQILIHPKRVVEEEVGGEKGSDSMRMCNWTKNLMTGHHEGSCGLAGLVVAYLADGWIGM
jgi:hypothetical protein